MPTPPYHRRTRHGPGYTVGYAVTAARDALFAAEALRVRHVGPLFLRLAAGECVGLAGASGSGKTLLLRALADLDPHAGQAYFRGQAASAIPGPAWRAQVGLLPTESHWWHHRVGDHFQDPRPDPGALGLPTEVYHWSVERLSSGERQRLALLRLLNRTPAVLLLDEPTANLDPAAARQVEALLDEYRLRHQAALLWVGHDTGQLRRVCARGWQLENGLLQPAPWT